MKNLRIAVAMAVVAASATMAMAQTSAPNKTAPTGSVIKTWSQGLSDRDVRMVDQITSHKSESDKWMIWTAIVRNREASRDIYAGEHLSNNKVLANVRVRMTTQETRRWAGTRSRLGSADLQAMVIVLRDDLARKH